MGDECECYHMGRYTYESCLGWHGNCRHECELSAWTFGWDAAVLLRAFPAFIAKL